jgi:hypothetical protein
MHGTGPTCSRRPGGGAAARVRGDERFVADQTDPSSEIITWLWSPVSQLVARAIVADP